MAGVSLPVALDALGIFWLVMYPVLIGCFVYAAVAVRNEARKAGGRS